MNNNGFYKTSIIQHKCWQTQFFVHHWNSLLSLSQLLIIVCYCLSHNKIYFLYSSVVCLLWISQHMTTWHNRYFKKDFSVLYCSFLCIHYCLSQSLVCLFANASWLSFVINYLLGKISSKCIDTIFFVCFWQSYSIKSDSATGTN